MTQFGELVTVPLREGWPHESQHFTPWMVENFDRLGRALGLGLEFRAKEHPVGRFFLDILAADGVGRTVAIENQFGPTNHDHLGKLLTYVAGTDAKVIVWVAETIGPEHLAALEWINDHTLRTSPPTASRWSCFASAIRRWLPTSGSSPARTR